MCITPRFKDKWQLVNVKWCDFVVYTNKGISIERIPFNSIFWESELLPKLTEFYTLCVEPEIVYPQHPVGLPIRDLRHEV